MVVNGLILLEMTGNCWAIMEIAGYGLKWLETSSAVSEATAENLASGLDELEAQQAKMTDATTKLLFLVAEAGGGPWSDSPGLTEDLLSEWLGVQEDRGDGLRDKVIRKQEELARLEEAGEEDFLGSVKNGQSASNHPTPEHN